MEGGEAREPRRRSRVKRWSRGAIRIGLRLILLAAALEALVRGVLWWAQISPPLVSDGVRGWRLAPHVVFQFQHKDGPYLLRTNSRGLRDGEYAYRKPTGRARIVVLGGSNVVGLGVPQEDAFTEILERSIPGTDVINMGCILYDLDQQFLTLRDEGMRYNPDVVLQFVNNAGTRILFSDYHPGIKMPKCRTMHVGESGDFAIAPPRMFGWHGIARHSAALRTVESFLHHREAEEPGPVAPEEQALRNAAMAKLLLATRELAESGGARHVVVYLPVDNEPDSDNHSVLLDLARDGRLTLLDLWPIFEEFFAGKGDHELVSLDGYHMTEYAHYRVAQAVRRFLDEEALLSWRSPVDFREN